MPDPPHICSLDADPRIVFAYESVHPFTVDPTGDLGLEYLFITADCRYFARPFTAEDGTWTPAREGRLSADALSMLNEQLLVLPWDEMVNENELVPPRVFDAGFRSLRRGTRRHYCNDGCPELLETVGTLMTVLYSEGAPLATPLLATGILGSDPDFMVIDVSLSVTAASFETAPWIEVSGEDASTLRSARDRARALPDFGERRSLPLRIDGVLTRVWFRETLPIEAPFRTLPAGLDPL